MIKRFLPVLVVVMVDRSDVDNLVADLMRSPNSTRHNHRKSET